MNKIITLITLLLISMLSIAGGPWLQKKGTGFVQAQAIVPAYQYRSLLMGTFIRDVQELNRRVYNADYGLYLEYGITDKLNVLTTLPFKHVKAGALTGEEHFSTTLAEGSLTGLSNYHVALKYALVDKEIKVAVSAHTRWNTIQQDLSKGLATGFDANSYGLMVHIGRSSAKHYGFLEAGFHKYTNNFSNALEINIEHGWLLNDHWTAALALNVRESLDNGSYYDENLAQTGLYPNDQEWTAISAKVFYERTNGWGINAGVPLIPIKFRYVGYNGTINMGIYKKF